MKPSGNYIILSAMTNPHNMCEIAKIKEIVPNIYKRIYELRQMGCEIVNTNFWLILINKPDNVILDHKNKRVLSGYFSNEQKRERDLKSFENQFNDNCEMIDEIKKDMKEIQSIIDEEIRNLSFFSKIGFYIYKFIHNLFK